MVGRAVESSFMRKFPFEFGTGTRFKHRPDPLQRRSTSLIYGGRDVPKRDVLPPVVVPPATDTSATPVAFGKRTQRERQAEHSRRLSLLRCSFCCKRQGEVKALFEGARAFICDECVSLLADRSG
jgi:hypothetical protein